VVALAHHAGDQVETFFVQLFRGAGGESLAGMKASSQSPASPGVRLVRPFLGIPRTELLRHAQCHSIRHREDSTNARTDFMRNRVRHELIPLIERDYQPALRRQVIRVMDVIGKESAYVREAAIRWLSSPAREEFGLLHPALQRQVVRIQLLRLGFDATYELAEHLRLRPGYRVMINPATVVWRETVGLICSREVVEPAFHQESAEVDLQAGQGEARFGGLCIAWRLSAADSAVDIKRTATQGQEVFDADRVGSPIGLRHWLPGDRFQPIGLGKPAKLQDLFTNSKVSRRRRRELVIATTASGELFWVDGLRIGERFKVQTGTSRFLRWSWRPAAQL
jgi:tRNA(Ile)-lysidine synthase